MGKKRTKIEVITELSEAQEAALQIEIPSELNESSFAPFKLLDLASIDERGGYSAFKTGPGYAMHGVGEYLMRTRYPDRLGDISFDPEGSMFAAQSENLESLYILIAMLRVALDDKPMFKYCFSLADDSLKH